MCSCGYHHKGFVVTHALGDIGTTLLPTFGYTLLVPLKERVLNKPSKEHNISSHQGLFQKITACVLCSNKRATKSSKGVQLLIFILIHIQIYLICNPETMSPLGYHHSGFVTAHALGHMICSYTLLIPMNQRVLNKPSKEHNISSCK